MAVLRTLVTAVCAVAAAFAGALLVAAQRWGAVDEPCRDTFVTVLQACAAAESPAWVVGLGAVVAGAAVLLISRRVRRG